MTKKSHSITSIALAGTLIALAPLATARTAGNVTVGQEARETLKEMKEMAAAAAGEADLLKSLCLNSSIDANAHLAPLWELKRDVNAMGKEVSGLEAERDSLDPWERQAVDRVLPLLKDAAANTESAIGYFNENRNRLWTPDYQAYAEKVRRDSKQIANTLKDYLKYEKARELEQRLQTTIEGGVN